jgi:hypothetical protein
LLLFGSNIVCCFIGEKKVLNGCKITYKSIWIRKTRFNLSSECLATTNPSPSNKQRYLIEQGKLNVQ